MLYTTETPITNCPVTTLCQKIKKYFLTQKYKKVANYSQKMKEENDHQTNLTKSKKKLNFCMNY